MKNGDQPAFPSVETTYNPEQDRDFTDTELGLTKREYFAAYAIQGIIGNTEMMEGLINSVSGLENPEDVIEAVSKMALLYADAMIEASNE